MPWQYRWAWLAELLAVLVGGLVALGLIIGLGWGEHGGWRLLAAAAVALGVAAVVAELPIGLARTDQAAAAAHLRRYADKANTGPAGQDY
ncbi:hypothetical protein GCM10010289_44310 [Streptomyces violascens]|uniref:Integral membrane protein n=2 Tax=Streptomyces violascens TaxID=67381 RepID=A0ABQ3QXL1_9ACTN|nr:hypothetical protein GCM10010289_44310 [Streptomyces violascens]GHI42023.1 hypothetical protein Sviol_64310 [Streptomyces violascens]